MSTELWGPALDAEIAYRRERVAAGLRAGRAGRGTGGVHGTRATTRAAAVRHCAAAGVPRRRWWLLGSGTWHVAR